MATSAITRRVSCRSARTMQATCRWMAHPAISNGRAIIPFDQLPASFNPPAGLIVTANQNPFPPDYPYAVNGNFASHYRSKQIRDMLSGRSGLRPEDTLAVQKDVYSAFQPVSGASGCGRLMAGAGTDARIWPKPSAAAHVERADGQGPPGAADRVRSYFSIFGRRWRKLRRQARFDLRNADGVGGDRKSVARAAGGWFQRLR